MLGVLIGALISATVLPLSILSAVGNTVRRLLSITLVMLGGLLGSLAPWPDGGSREPLVYVAAYLATVSMAFAAAPTQWEQLWRRV